MPLFHWSSYSSCKKNGLGGNAKIYGTVKHHDTIVPGAIVYIKYGVKEFPGTNTSFYNETRVTGNDAKFTFDQLLRGSYFIYAVGYDSSIAQTVSGGIYVEIPNNNNIITTDLAVTE